MVAGLAPAARALRRISSRSCRFLLLTSFASASSADICVRGAQRQATARSIAVALGQYFNKIM